MGRKLKTDKNSLEGLREGYCLEIRKTESMIHRKSSFSRIKLSYLNRIFIGTAFEVSYLLKTLIMYAHVPTDVFLCVSLYMYFYMHLYMLMYIYICINLCACILCIYVHICIHTYICYVWLCMCVCEYVGCRQIYFCTYLCMYTYLCVGIYV